jgi:hypothetical protein
MGKQGMFNVVSLLVQKFLCRTRRFITMLTRGLYWTMYSANTQPLCHVATDGPNILVQNEKVYHHVGKRALLDHVPVHNLIPHLSKIHVVIQLEFHMHVSSPPMRGTFIVKYIYMIMFGEEYTTSNSYFHPKLYTR